ncbi:MAG TPA: TVP38/TMEM64 family protein [Solirubrobacteraceae bacterium]
MSRRAAVLRLGALFVVLLAAFLAVTLTGSLSAHRVRDWVHGHGALGPALYVGVSVGLALAFFPGPVLAGAAGLLFGTALGTPVALLSAVLTACLAFSISRWVARDTVYRHAPPRAQAVAHWVDERGFVAILLVRLAPGIPYMAVNYSAGLTKLPLPTFAAATVIGAAPRTFGYVALGGSLGHFDRPEAIIAVAVIVIEGVIGFVLLRRHGTGLRAARPPGSGRGSSCPGGRSAGRR